jgi:hypothetical protein
LVVFLFLCDMNHKFAGTARLWFFLFAANLCFQDVFNVAFKSTHGILKKR